MGFKKILAIKLRALGDTVLMTAPLIELRKAYPHAEIHALVHEPWTSVVDGHAAVNRVWPYQRHADRGARAKAMARMALRLRREGYDCVVNFHASPSSAILAFATGAKTRSVHFHGHRDRNRYSTVIVPGKGVLKPVIERDMDAVRALGLLIPEGRAPQVQIRDSELSLAEEHIKRLGLSRPLLAIGLGASRPTKAWPVEKYAELAIAWCQKRGGSAFAMAGPDEARLTNEFLALVDAASSPDIRARISASHQMKVRETAALLSTCSAFAGNDSGPKHLAVAVGTPTLTLFGPEHPFEWHPYPTDQHPYLFIENLNCRQDAAPGMPAWCALDRCVIEQHRCMRAIGVDAALTECLRIARP